MSRFDLSAWGSRHRGVDTLALPDGRVLYNDGHAALVTHTAMVYLHRAPEDAATVGRGGDA